MISKAQVHALAAGDAWIEEGGQSPVLPGRPAQENPISRPRSRLALVEKGWRVLFTRTTDLVQKLQARAPRSRPRGRDRQARRKYHLLILDDLAYLAKDQAETSVLFELIGARYERRSPR